MILIQNVLVEEEIASTNFSCDLEKCKGACCTFPGEFGAPVLDEEVGAIENCMDAAKEYLSDRSKKYIEKHGFVKGDKGSYNTVCINNRDCVFVYYEGDIALCALEKAYRDGKTDFIKPVSCHLFPVRMGDFGGTSIYYEKIKECNPALEKGKTEGVHIHDSIKTALIRSFGEEWFKEYLEKIENLKDKK